MTGVQAPAQWDTPYKVGERASIHDIQAVLGDHPSHLTTLPLRSADQRAILPGFHRSPCLTSPHLICCPSLSERAMIIAQQVIANTVSLYCESVGKQTIRLILLLLYAN
jgi:hypothetical protein